MEKNTKLEGKFVIKRRKGGTYKSYSPSHTYLFYVVLLIPSTLCKELEGLMAKFWRGDQSDARKIHWVSWEKMCQPKEVEGLGFKDLHVFNLAMLAKQGWRIMRNQDSLLARILKAKYFANGDFMNAQLGCNPSYTQRSILEGRTVLEKGLVWRVGNGSRIRINEDPWVPKAPNFQVQMKSKHQGN